MANVVAVSSAGRRILKGTSGHDTTVRKLDKTRNVCYMYIKYTSKANLNAINLFQSGADTGYGKGHP